MDETELTIVRSDAELGNGGLSRDDGSERGIGR